MILSTYTENNFISVTAQRLLDCLVLLNMPVCILLQLCGVSLCDGCIHFFLLLMEDDHILEVHVRSVEFRSIYGAIEGVSKGLVIRVLVVVPNSAVTERLVVVGLEVMFALLDVGCQNDEESVGLASLLPFRKQQTFRVTAITLAL